MGRGGISGTDQNPAISAVAITEVLAGPPSFAVHPCDQSQPAGGTATFSVTAGGSPVPTLQWRKNGTPIPGQTSSTLTLTSLSAADVTTYDCVATNENGSTTSNTATLTLAPIVTASAITADLKGYWRFDERRDAVLRHFRPASQRKSDQLPRRLQCTVDPRGKSAARCASAGRPHSSMSSCPLWLCRRRPATASPHGCRRIPGPCGPVSRRTGPALRTSGSMLPAGS